MKCIVFTKTASFCMKIVLKHKSEQFNLGLGILENFVLARSQLSLLTSLLQGTDQFSPNLTDDSLWFIPREMRDMYMYIRTCRDTLWVDISTHTHVRTRMYVDRVDIGSYAGNVVNWTTFLCSCTPHVSYKLSHHFPRTGEMGFTSVIFQKELWINLFSYT